MATLEQEVRAAPNPLEALLIIARAVDELAAAKAAVPTLDSWAGWVPDNGQAAAVGAPPAPQAPVHKGITEADLTDDVVIAWIRKNYKGAAGFDPASPEGQMAIVQVRDDLLHAPNIEQVTDLFRTTTAGVVESEIDWSPLTNKHRAARYDFAKRVLQLDIALGAHPMQGDWAADYASGGPMYFYIPNRDLVMQYPDQVRSQMVEDVRVTSHARLSQTVADKVTHEFGADVLKQPMSTDLEGRGAPQPVGMREADL